MSSSEVVISVKNLGKRFEIYDQPSDRLKQFLFPRIQKLLGQPPKQYFGEFWALNNISFDLKKGETIGIVGRNGSGKSTLLQMICGTLTPSIGGVTTKGRIGALLELGSGFNSDFTGRENVYMNAAVLGLSNEEIDAKFEDIVSFADIGEFIERPVKTYSSGMLVRLAFAVQAQVSPDILIVDEALAVGDAKFQAKCFNRINQMKANGTSILLVTHSSEQVVTHCDYAILLDQGGEICQGEPRAIINRYMDLLFGRDLIDAVIESPADKSDLKSKKTSSSLLSVSEDKFSTRIGFNPHEYRWGDGAAKILDYYILADGEAYPSSFEVGQGIELMCSVAFIKTLINPIFGFTIKTKDGITVYGINSEKTDLISFKEVGLAGQLVIVSAKFKCMLGPGDYFISVGLATIQGEHVIPHDRRYDSIHIQVRPDKEFFGLINLSCKLDVEDVM